MSVVGGGMPMWEGLVTYELARDGYWAYHASGSFRRNQDDGGHIDALDEPGWELVRSRVNLIHKYRPHSPVLSQAIYLWGRSILAEVRRDQLLNAVVGLESLLVGDKKVGDKRNVLSRHGAALVQPYEGKPAGLIKDELSTLYEARNTVAHGDVVGHLGLASIATHHLTNTILGILELTRDGILDPSQHIPTQLRSHIAAGHPRLTPP